MTPERQAVAYLQTPQAIRDRSQILFELACADQLDHFRCDLSRLPEAAQYVLSVIQASYPKGDIPFHSRWRHFEVEGISRLAQIAPALSQLPPQEQARLKVDLAIVSVLLDAGAGAQWQYREPGTGQGFSRSEGLALASFHSFCAGLFSSDPDQPWRADAEGLRRLTAEALAAAFQVTDHNPLVGLEGRVALLQKLGHVLTQSPELFGAATPRPGGLVDYWMGQTQGHQLSATAVLQAILTGLGPIWPGRVTLGGVNLGDVWPHPHLPDQGLGSQFVPFHKLSQWLTYSLLEPLQDLGLTITDINALTGLAEYRNGGLFIDLDVIVPKDSALLRQPIPVEATAIVEWRALTVILLDHLAEAIRQSLHLTPTELPLVKVLQGGTWTAGRHIAAAKRPQATPPITLISDGTVF